MIVYKDKTKNYEHLMRVDPNYWERKLKNIQDLKMAINKYNDKIALQEAIKRLGLPTELWSNDVFIMEIYFLLLKNKNREFYCSIFLHGREDIEKIFEQQIQQYYNFLKDKIVYLEAEDMFIARIATIKSCPHMMTTQKYLLDLDLQKQILSCIYDENILEIAIFEILYNKKNKNTICRIETINPSSTIEDIHNNQFHAQIASEERVYNSFQMQTRSTEKNHVGIISLKDFHVFNYDCFQTKLERIIEDSEMTVIQNNNLQADKSVKRIEHIPVMHEYLFYDFIDHVNYIYDENELQNNINYYIRKYNLDFSHVPFLIEAIEKYADILEIEQLEYYKKFGYNEEQYLLNASMDKFMCSIFPFSKETQENTRKLIKQ